MTEYTRSYYDHRLNITLSNEREALMDSGGGVKKALPYLGDGAFLLLNSDMIWRDGPRPMLHRMQAAWQPDDMDILMLLIPRAGAFGFDGAGDYHRADDGRLRARGANSNADYIYGGIMMMTDKSFDDTPNGPFSLRMQFDRAEKKGRLYGIIHDGGWYHVGTPDARDALEEIFTTCRGD
jgi:MurNAc alpha-1-phosphate uridylyltransferase